MKSPPSPLDFHAGHFQLPVQTELWLELGSTGAAARRDDAGTMPVGKALSTLNQKSHSSESNLGFHAFYSRRNENKSMERKKCKEMQNKLTSHKRARGINNSSLTPQKT